MDQLTNLYDRIRTDFANEAEEEDSEQNSKRTPSKVLVSPVQEKKTAKRFNVYLEGTKLSKREIKMNDIPPPLLTVDKIIDSSTTNAIGLPYKSSFCGSSIIWLLLSMFALPLSVTTESTHYLSVSYDRSFDWELHFNATVQHSAVEMDMSAAVDSILFHEMEREIDQLIYEFIAQYEKELMTSENDEYGAPYNTTVTWRASLKTIPRSSESNRRRMSAAQVPLADLPSFPFDLDLCGSSYDFKTGEAGVLHSLSSTL